jgi:hypothetical protein
MFTARLLICLGILALTTPAFNAQFFIVQDSATNRCTITEQPPDLNATVSNPLPTSPHTQPHHKTRHHDRCRRAPCWLGMVPMETGPPQKLT